jgi:hypothetical protein
VTDTNKQPVWDSAGIERQRREFDAVNWLAIRWQTLSMTPVVDDDYPEARHNYESALKTLIDALKVNRPEVFGQKR